MKTHKSPCGLHLVSMSRLSGIKAFSQQSDSHQPFMSFHHFLEKTILLVAWISWFHLPVLEYKIQRTLVLLQKCASQQPQNSLLLLQHLFLCQAYFMCKKQKRQSANSFICKINLFLLLCLKIPPSISEVGFRSVLQNHYHCQCS